jgi:hypothetical protein
MAPRKTPMRTKKKQQNSGGVNPLLVALGAGAGAAAGRRATGALARRNVTNRAARMAEIEMEMMGPRGRSAEQISREAAGTVADREYTKMPRANDQRLANYRGMLANKTGEPGEVARARRNAGISKKDTDKYYNKSDARYRIADGKRRADGGQSLIEEASFLRGQRKIGRNTRRGAAGGAALAALAQLVLAEINKKK